MLALLRGLPKRWFALDRKDVERAVAAAVKLSVPVGEGRDPLTSTYTELEVDPLKTVEIAAASMFTVGIWSDDLPEVSSGAELVTYILNLEQEKIAAKERAQKKKEEEDED